jgi:catechol 2,3-dioxygenase-like lactoylglutathione lyase family enzyme
MTATASSRKLDHLVLPAHDLDAQAVFYTRLGFKLGVRNVHPWGTENRIIQFGDSFLELITLGTTAVPPLPTLHQFSFGHHVGQALQRAGDGMAMLAFASIDSTADARWFDQAGIAAFQPFHFARKGKRPDGSDMDVAFTLAFTMPASMPELCFFMCQHHNPENFWNAANQNHDNGVTGISRVVVVRDNPVETLGFLKAFAGGKPQYDKHSGCSVETPNGTLSVWTPDAIQRYCGADPVFFDGRRARFSVISFVTNRLDKLEMILRNNNLPHRRDVFDEITRIVVPSGVAFGVVLCFEQETA